MFLIISSQREDSIPGTTADYANPIGYADDAATHPHRDEYAAMLAAFMQKGIPGCSLLIETTEGIWTGAGGLADIEYRIACLKNQRSRVCRISKTFTAVSVMLLCDRGEIDLDASINTYLAPGYLNAVKNPAATTVKMLLNHTGGIPYYLSYLNFLNKILTNPGEPMTMEETLAYVNKEDANFEPGTGFEYSGTNYILPGLILEHITGKTIYQVIKDEVITPLNLQSTQFNEHDPIPADIPSRVYRCLG